MNLFDEAIFYDVEQAYYLLHVIGDESWQLFDLVRLHSPIEEELVREPFARVVLKPDSPYSTSYYGIDFEVEIVLQLKEQVPGIPGMVACHLARKFRHIMEVRYA